jgi:hypothetical protein
MVIYFKSIGHNGWVTSLRVGIGKNEKGEDEEFLISGSRGNNIFEHIL